MGSRSAALPLPWTALEPVTQEHPLWQVGQPSLLGATVLWFLRPGYCCGWCSGVWGQPGGKSHFGDAGAG